MLLLCWRETHAAFLVSIEFVQVPKEYQECPYLIISTSILSRAICQFCVQESFYHCTRDCQHQWLLCHCHVFSVTVRSGRARSEGAPHPVQEAATDLDPCWPSWHQETGQGWTPGECVCLQWHLENQECASINDWLLFTDNILMCWRGLK